MVKSVKEMSIQELFNELLPKYRAVNQKERLRLGKHLEDYLLLKRRENDKSMV
jgi:hypothetical protein